MRKLATIRKIDKILPIEGADAIECAVVGGWKTVTKKNEFQVGDLVVYLEVDSWVPTELAPFLSKGKDPREFNGVKGERLRTVKLRGQISQGLLIPAIGTFPEGTDMTDALGIQKWEMPISPQLAGQVKGNFPTQIPKTDQERVQNLIKEIKSVAFNTVFEITEKLEGSSMTCYLIDGEFGVCSRNMDLKRDENNSFWNTAIEQNIEQKMRDRGMDNCAIQGELIGPGIQGNIYDLNKHEFHVFDIYDIKSGEYFPPKIRQDIVYEIGLAHVPVIANNGIISDNIEQILSLAEGTSVLNTKRKQEREGIVFKEMNGGMTFKAISNRYLLNEK